MQYCSTTKCLKLSTDFIFKRAKYFWHMKDEKENHTNHAVQDISLILNKVAASRSVSATWNSSKSKYNDIYL